MLQYRWDYSLSSSRAPANRSAATAVTAVIGAVRAIKGLLIFPPAFLTASIMRLVIRLSFIFGVNALPDTAWLDTTNIVNPAWVKARKASSASDKTKIFDLVT